MASTYEPRVVLFVDICGSTQLYENLGDKAAAAKVESCLAALRIRIEAAGGRVIQRVGDELMCLFETGDGALDAAQSMQESLLDAGAFGEAAIGIRVGCHYGPVIEKTGDLFGDTVNVAARAAAVAKAGQVITTEDTVATMSRAARDKLRVLGRFTLRGKREDLTLYELVWQDNADLTLVGTLSDLRVQTARLTLHYGGREFHLDSRDRGALTLGRDAGCDVIVTDVKASRRHARIETRRDKFVLIDQSVNGTYVRIGEEEIVVQREELILYAHGVFSLGHRSAAPAESVIEFACS